MALKLWELSEKLEALLHEAVDPTTGELDESKLEAIDDLEESRSEKILAIAGVIKGEEAEGDAVLDQAKKLEARAKKHFKRAERLRGYIDRNMRDGEQFTDSRHIVKFRYSEAVKILNLDDVPEQYVSVPIVSPRADKAALKSALKKGSVPGAEIEKRRKVVVE